MSAHGLAAGAWRPRVPFFLCLVGACLTLGLLLGGCGSGPQTGSTGTIQVVAVGSYLADIVRNVAGGHLEVTSLIAEGVDPHSFEPTPRDAKLLARSRLVIIDVKGLTPGVDSLIKGVVQPGTVVVQAAQGLHARRAVGDEGGPGEVDPHFWLDPNNVVGYVQKIRDALISVDTAHAAAYRSNAERYMQQLHGLDEWIRGQVESIPEDRRVLVTNHETFGYFADRYGFKVAGSIFQTMGTEGAPSAKQLAILIRTIKQTKAPAVFLEAGSNSELADEVGRETGVKIVENLYTHSLGPGAPTYIEMMQWDVRRIVEALR